MKMYLSSYHLGNNPNQYVSLFGTNKNVAVIMNAMDFISEAERKLSLDREVKDLSELGLNPTEIDLRDYFDKPVKLKDALQPFGGVWIRGGNVFLLRKAMSYSSFDKYISEINTKPQFVYAGFSAGICVMGPSLKGLELVDFPETTPTHYQPQIIWNGLNLLAYTLIPHFQSNHPESKRIEKVVMYFKEHKLPYRTLSDGEAIVIE